MNLIRPTHSTLMVNQKQNCDQIALLIGKLNLIKHNDAMSFPYKWLWLFYTNLRTQ